MIIKIYLIGFLINNVCFIMFWGKLVILTTHFIKLEKQMLILLVAGKSWNFIN